MEIATGLLSADAYLRVVEQLVSFLGAEGVGAVSVCYGFGCDCPDDELYRPVAIPLAGLLDFIAAGVAADYYRVGRDNLHVTDAGGRVELLLCHESDIHVIADDAGLCGRLMALWRAGGVPVAPPRGSTEAEPGAAADGSRL